MHISKLIQDHINKLDRNELVYLPLQKLISGIDNTGKYCVILTAEIPSGKHTLIGTHDAFTNSVFLSQMIFRKYVQVMFSNQYIPMQLIRMYPELNMVRKTKYTLMFINKMSDIVVHISTKKSRETQCIELHPEFRKFNELLLEAAIH